MRDIEPPVSGVKALIIESHGRTRERYIGDLQ